MGWVDGRSRERAKLLLVGGYEKGTYTQRLVRSIVCRSQIRRFNKVGNQSFDLYYAFSRLYGEHRYVDLAVEERWNYCIVT